MPLSAVADTHHAATSGDTQDALTRTSADAREVAQRVPPTRGGLMGLMLHAPLALVLLSLTLLAVIPLLEQRRMAARLDQISQIVDPARTAVADMQVALALEAAGTRGFLLTGEAHYAASHRTARENRRRAYARLRELSPSLDPAHRSTIMQMGEHFDAADALLDRFYAGRMSRQEYMSHLQDQHRHFVAITAATTLLQHEIRGLAAAKRHEVHSIQRFGSYTSLAGVVIALASVFAVARLSSRHRRLAWLERASRQESERARAEAERRREEAERLGASRAGLMRGFSHDVKNALGTADGYLFMLEEGVMTSVNAAQRAGVEKARRCLKTANELIEDLLEFARAQAGEMVLHRGATDLRQLALRVADDYRVQAHVNGLALAVDAEEEFPLVDTDAERVTQIVSNLLSNAVKYTHAGGVTLRLALRDGDDRTSYAVVDVIDTGPGIPDAARTMIFDEFRRFDVAGGRRGTGIGLAISQRIATTLGGRITVESASGRGSTFTLWLPLQASGPAAT